MTESLFFPFPTDMRGLWKRQIDKTAFSGFKSVRNEEVHARLKGERLSNIEITRNWRDAAERDGWQFYPTYNQESVDRAWSGDREGFKVMGITRTNDEKYLGTGDITMWGPDGLQIKVPTIYPGMAYFKSGLRHCKYCGNDDVETVRISFAGRCCKACHPEQAKIQEGPGWCD